MATVLLLSYLMECEEELTEKIILVGDTARERASRLSPRG
jgi:hypothetical protein